MNNHFKLTTIGQLQLPDAPPLNTFKMARQAKLKPLPSTKSPFPAPFEEAPPILVPWLNTLAKSPVYLTHIDPHPRALKQTIYIVPVILNLLFVALLAWRFSVTLPWYATLAQQLWTHRHAHASTLSSPLSSQHDWLALLRTELRHFVTVAIDYALLSIVAPWPWSFFLERGGNPVAWRLRCGFRERELVVRRSRGWAAEEVLAGQKKGGESPFWRTRVLPYVQLDKMSKTGYLMMDGNWDLDFGAMTDGQLRLGKEFKEDDLNGKIFCWFAEGDDSGKWIMWDFRKEMYMSKTNTAGSMPSSSSAEGDVEEGRRMIMRFRDKLTEMGKEDLFFRWVELIQYESSQPGGFTRERQEQAGQKVKELFVEAGVDFEEFEKSAGIRDGKIVD
jgi:hypothetical protein